MAMRLSSHMSSHLMGRQDARYLACWQQCMFLTACSLPAPAAPLQQHPQPAASPAQPELGSVVQAQLLKTCKWGVQSAPYRSLPARAPGREPRSRLWLTSTTRSCLEASQSSGSTPVRALWDKS